MPPPSDASAPARPRVIVHLDADAFFVSVEQARNPSLKGKKVAVGGQQRGIISSASYEARACGVYTPMPTTRARKVCPGLIIVPHSSGVYGPYSRRVFDLCETITPWVERASIDEGYLDFTPCGFPTFDVAVEAARALQARITRELDITVSFGIATNKLVAAVASKLRKPRGFTVVPPGEEAAFFAPLGLGRMPGVGPKAEAALKAFGWETVDDVLSSPEDEWPMQFGSAWRGMIETLRGLDDRPVETEQGDAKSHSQQQTFFQDIGDWDTIVREAKGMLDELVPKLREDGKVARTLTLKVRYPDFTHTSASHAISEASALESAFYPWVEPLLKTAWKQRTRPLRLISVRLSDLSDPAQQLDLFSGPETKREKLAKTLDALRAKTGAGSVVRGSSLAPSANDPSRPKNSGRGKVEREEGAG